jgi:O-antigen ligase
MLAVYVMAAQLFATPRRLTTLFAIVGLSGVVPAIIGIKELVHGAPKADGLDISRISGPFTGPNSFGMFLALTALVLIGLPRKTLPMWVRLAAVTPILVALVATYSRAGWVLFLFGLAVLVWRRNPALIGAAAVTVGLLIAFVPSIHDRVLPPPNAKDSPIGGGVTTPESYQFRLNNWNSLLTKWSSRPLTGYGLQTTQYANPRRVFDPTGTADTSGYDAHNSVVKILVEGGVVLLVVWVCLIATMTARLRNLARRDWAFTAQSRSVFVLWVSLILIGLTTDDPLAATATMCALFALSGAVEGTYDSLSRLPARSPENVSAPDGATSR